MKLKLRRWEHPRDTIFWSGMTITVVGAFLSFTGYEKIVYMSVMWSGLFIALVANIFFGGIKIKRGDRKIKC